MRKGKEKISKAKHERQETQQNSSSPQKETEYQKKGRLIAQTYVYMNKHKEL